MAFTAQMAALHPLLAKEAMKGKGYKLNIEESGTG
jgi:hypothetical protein